MGVQLQLGQLLLFPAHVLALPAQLRRLAGQPVSLLRQRPDRFTLPGRLLLQRFPGRTLLVTVPAALLQLRGQVLPLGGSILQLPPEVLQLLPGGVQLLRQGGGGGFPLPLGLLNILHHVLAVESQGRAAKNMIVHMFS